VNIIAVIVTFNPDLMQLEKTINSLVKQVDCIIIIDNGDTLFSLAPSNNLIFINLGENKGIAYAQNRGIEKALGLGARFIILSDQDTIYPEKYIDNNLFIYNLLHSKKIAALVPVYYDAEKKMKSPIMLTKFSCTCNYSKQYMKTAQAISSGSFIITDSLKEIGFMDEKLFIDYVDFEWCWRATRLGFIIITIPDILIIHHLGDNVNKIGTKNIFIRNNMRYYYIIRNGIYLAIYSNYLFLYERFLLIKSVFKQIIAVLFIKANFNSVKVIVAALYEGMSGKMRKFQ
jgi:rhamnosyltransferase